ncbi:MAG: hypothetical protein M3Y70_07415 [Pseudomonadota bacterium]|nr:hypothetical protein [Pseudomonadota bacterium]
MSLPTLGMTGMDPATEGALKAAFDQANARLGKHWRLLPEAEARFVVVDMDSMYGPMSWLRLHAAGKQVIGLTSAKRTQTDFHLPRPFDAASVAVLLQAILPDLAASTPAGMAAAPVPQDELPEEHPQAIDEEALAPGPVPGHPGSAEAGSLAPATVAPATPAPQRTLGDWFVPGALGARVRFARDGGPELYIDPVAREYYGPGALKPLAGYVQGAVAEHDFHPVEPAAWDAAIAPLGAAQPLARLQWYGGLLAGGGNLLPGFDLASRYKLSKWPQTEREYPKHFRIATAMMKGPATLDEVSAASGVPLPDVVDFVNASLATGYAELVPEQPPEPVDTGKSGGLFGRRKK